MTKLLGDHRGPRQGFAAAARGLDAAGDVAIRAIAIEARGALALAFNNFGIILVGFVHDWISLIDVL